MLPSNARHSNQGFTLIEMLVILIIIGILSAISVPSFLGLLNRNKVNNALAQVRGALQETQREAIRKSKSCSVTLDTTSTPNKVTGTCLVTGNRNLNGINIRSNVSPITFNFRGETGSSGTIVVASTDGSVAKQKCLVIASGIGLIRYGNYADNNHIGTDPDKCTTSQ